MSSISGGSVRNNVSQGSLSNWSLTSSKKSSKRSQSGSVSSRSNSNSNNNVSSKKVVNITAFLEGLKLNGVIQTPAQRKRIAARRVREEAKRRISKIKSLAARQEKHRRGLLKNLHPSIQKPFSMWKKVLKKRTKPKSYARNKEYAKTRVKK